MHNKYFTEEVQQKVIKYLKKKWKEPKRVCEICGSKSWTLAGDLVMPLIFPFSRALIGEREYPHILIVCNNCGNSKMFNAVIFKIFNKEVKNERRN